MDLSSHPSSFGYKKENFRKEIRREKINQQFVTRRKILFRDSHTLTNPSSAQLLTLNSWDDVKQQLSAFTPNYAAINVYIYANFQKGMPQEIERSFVSLVHRPQFLTNEDSLALLATLTLVKSQQDQSIFEPGTIKLIINNLLKWSIVEVEVNGKPEERINYYETVCWILSLFTDICKDDKEEVFEGFRLKKQVFEKSSTCLSFQQLTLFYCLSTHPSFLPSSHFIRHIIKKSFELKSSESKPAKELMAPLLDNFMRFQEEENLELTLLYIDFIYHNLYEMVFSPYRKVELIKLFTTLVKSTKDTNLNAMFAADNTMKLFQLIFYKAQHGDWESKKASLLCMTAMMSREVLLSYLSKGFTPSEMAFLFYNSILLEDPEVQIYVISAIFCACSMEPKIYVKEFRNLKFDFLLKRIQDMEAESRDKNNQQIKLSDYLITLQEYFKKWEKEIQNQQTRVPKRAQLGYREDFEI